MKEAIKKEMTKALTKIEGGKSKPCSTLEDIIKNKHSSSDFLNAVLTEAAAECDALRAARENSSEVLDVTERSQISSRRVQALRFLTEMYVEKNKKNKQSVDLKSQQIQFLIKSLVQKFRQTIEEFEGLPPGTLKKIFQNFTANTENWEEEVMEQLEAMNYVEGN